MHGRVFVLEARGWNVDFFVLFCCGPWPMAAALMAQDDVLVVDVRGHGVYTGGL